MPQDVGTRRALERMNALSDGVFAVALTLIVLNIETPTVPGDDLWEALKELGPDLSAYFIGFAVIGLFWYAHSSLLSSLDRTSRPLAMTNLLMLSLIALMPFTTSLMGSYENEPLAIAAYALNIGAAASVDSILDQICLRGDLFVEGQRPDPRTLTIEGILRPMVFILSIPLAFVAPEFAQLFWLMLLFTRDIAERIAGGREPATP